MYDNRIARTVFSHSPANRRTAGRTSTRALRIEQFEPRRLLSVTVTELDKLLPVDAGDGDNIGKSVSVSGETIVTGARNHDSAGNNAGAAFVYLRNGSAINQQAKLTATDASPGDRLGISVSASGNTIVAGAYLDDDGGSGAGSAYVFTRNGASWTQQSKLTASDGSTQDQFGFAVAVSGDTAVVGAKFDDDNGTDSGSAYVFQRNGSTWTQQAKLVASDGSANDQFGFSVAISSDTVVVGAYLDNAKGTDSGSAYVYVRNGDVWTQQAKLNAPDGELGDQFGHGVAISENTLLVGSRFDDDNGNASGSAHVFARSGATWSHQSKLTAEDGAPSERFGHAVSISGDKAVIGAFSEDRDGTGVSDNAGAAYAFSRSGTTWTQDAKFVATDAASDDLLGFSTGVSDNTAVVGAEKDVTTAGKTGSIYAFDVTGEVPDDQPAEISIAPTFNAAEPATDGLFTLTTTQLLAVPVTIDLDVMGTATPDSDYTTIGATIVFPAQTSAITIPVDVLTDGVTEPTETVIISLTGTDQNQVAVVNASSNTATITIADEEVSTPPTGDVYVSAVTNGTAGSVSFADEDIMVFDSATSAWSMFFDASDVGITSDLQAFQLENDNSLLLSVQSASNLPGGVSAQPQDVVRFIPTTYGDTTAGTFEMVLDGSTVGLSKGGEAIDAISRAPNGDLLLSTIGNAIVPGLSARDEDLIRFDASTANWELFFDGSDVDMLAGAEDLDGATVDSVSGDVYLTTEGAYSVSGASGSGLDILLCELTSSGTSSACSWTSFFDGSSSGISARSLDGISIVRSSSGVIASASMSFQSRAAELVPGDVDGNGFVQFSDFAIMASQFGQHGEDLSADITNDGVVDRRDFRLLQSNFAPSPVRAEFVSIAFAADPDQKVADWWIDEPFDSLTLL